MRDTARFLLYVFYCIEGGLFLAFAPWSRIWAQNYFFQRFEWVRAVGLSPLTRGLVSGLGAALLLHGAHEIVSAALGYRRRRGAGDRAAR